MIKNYKIYVCIAIIIVLGLNYIATMINIFEETNYKKKITFEIAELKIKNRAVSFIIPLFLIYILVWTIVGNVTYNMYIDILINILISLIAVLLLERLESQRPNKPIIEQVIYGISVESIKNIICDVLDKRRLEYEIIDTDKEWTKSIYVKRSNLKIKINDKYTGANTPKISFIGTLEDKEMINEISEIINREPRKYSGKKFGYDFLEITLITLLFIAVLGIRLGL